MGIGMVILFSDMENIYKLKVSLIHAFLNYFNQTFQDT